MAPTPSVRLTWMSQLTIASVASAGVCNRSLRKVDDILDSSNLAVGLSLSVLRKTDHALRRSTNHCGGGGFCPGFGKLRMVPADDSAEEPGSANVETRSNAPECAKSHRCQIQVQTPQSHFHQRPRSRTTNGGDEAGNPIDFRRTVHSVVPEGS